LNIAKILAHLEANATEPEGCRLPPCRDGSRTPLYPVRVREAIR
jgi:hypothetical protein